MLVFGKNWKTSFTLVRNLLGKISHHVEPSVRFTEDVDFVAWACENQTAVSHRITEADSFLASCRVTLGGHSSTELVGHNHSFFVHKLEVTPSPFFKLKYQNIMIFLADIDNENINTRLSSMRTALGISEDTEANTKAKVLQCVVYQAHIVLDCMGCLTT